MAQADGQVMITLGLLSRIQRHLVGPEPDPATADMDDYFATVREVDRLIEEAQRGPVDVGRLPLPTLFRLFVGLKINKVWPHAAVLVLYGPRAGQRRWREAEDHAGS